MGDYLTFDFRNGQRSFPEIDRLMQKLLGYEERHYHAPGAPRPRMVPMTKWVKRSPGASIFPGGSGVYGDRIARNGVVLLFQDFDVLSLYVRAVDHGYTALQVATSRIACELLAEAGYDLAQCFLTNRFVGVRDADDQYGANPGWKSPRSKLQYKPYVKMCDDMLKAQLDEFQPRLVLMFGTHVPRSLGLDTLWQEKLIQRISLFGHEVATAVLTHPSLRHLNIGKVAYRDLRGHEAELGILRDALVAAHLS